MVGLVAGSGAAYTASKHGVVGLTKSAAVAYAQRGIRVNAVCPGFIRSPMTEPLMAGDPARAETFIARHPVGRAGVPEEVAAAVVWLCSEAASFVTGHTMSVTGAMWLSNASCPNNPEGYGYGNGGLVTEGGHPVMEPFGRP